MRIRRIVLTGLAGAMLVVAPVAADMAPMQPLPERQPEPGAALAAAAANIVYVPVRLALTVCNAAVGGLTGLVTTNADHAADDVFTIADGQGVLQPENIEGREPVRVGEYYFSR